MSVDRFFVVIDRTSDDGSRTYKGPWRHDRGAREADAWSVAFPGYVVQLVAETDGRPDFSRWRKATSAGGRYYPVIAAT